MKFGSIKSYWKNTVMPSRRMLFSLSFRSIKDAKALQCDVNALVSRSEKNQLPFNILKWEKITFSRKRNEIRTTYEMRDTPVKTTELVKDLGVLIDERMSFITHMNQLIRRVRTVMGYIFRNSRDFKNIQTLKKLLYHAFVRSCMKFGMLP